MTQKKTLMFSTRPLKRSSQASACLIHNNDQAVFPKIFENRQCFLVPYRRPDQEGGFWRGELCFLQAWLLHHASSQATDCVWRACAHPGVVAIDRTKTGSEG